MRLSSLALAATLLVASSGCDSTGIDSAPPGGTPPPTAPPPAVPPTTPQPSTAPFARVAPQATYLRADDGTPAATAYALSQYGLRPGDTACFRSVGDYTIYTGGLASASGNPLVTGVFSATQTLSATSERNRVKDAIDGPWDLNTRPLYSNGAVTEIDEDFNATDNCWTVPATAAYVFFSVYDDAYFDNADVNQPFGVTLTRR